MFIASRKDKKPEVLQSFLSTVLISLAMGGLLVALRRILRLSRKIPVDLGLTLLGGVLLVLFHLVSRDLFGLDPWYGLGFEIAKHGLELLVILMILVAF